MNAHMKSAAILLLAVTLLPIGYSHSDAYASSRHYLTVTGYVTTVRPGYIIVRRKRHSRMFIHRFFITKDTVINGALAPGTMVSVDYTSVKAQTENINI